GVHAHCSRRWRVVLLRSPSPSPSQRRSVRRTRSAEVRNMKATPKKIARVLGSVLATLLVLLLIGLFGASMKARARLSRQVASHRIDIPVPNPLTQDELAALRAEGRT